MSLLTGFDEIAREFGLYTGYGRDPDVDWAGTDAADDFEACLREGINEFLTAGGYQWQYLRPIQSLVLWPTQEIVLSGTPTYSNPSSTLTAAAAAFRPLMLGKSITFATSGHSYPISEVLSATQVKVTGNASAEAAGDTISITADGDYRLPAGFAGLADKLYFTDAAGTCFGPLDLMGPSRVLHQRSRRGTNTGRPELVATSPVELDQTVGPQWVLMVAPTPDQEYTLKYRARLTPELLTSNLPYLVQPPYSVALLESVLAAAEAKLRPAEMLHRNLYTRALMEAVSFDRRHFGAKTVGLNTDPGLGWGAGAGCERRTSYVRVNGIIPGVG